MVNRFGAPPRPVLPLPVPAIWMLCVLALASAGLIGAVLAGEGAVAFDDPVRDWMLERRTGTATTVATAVTHAGGGMVTTLVAALAAVLLVRRGHGWPAGLILVAAVGAQPLSNVSKILIDRDRPPTGDHLVQVASQSFPSGHSLGSFVVATVLAVVAVAGCSGRALRSAIAGAAAIFVVAVGLSRIYLGVHWPTDVLGGWSMGAVWVGLCLLGYRATTTARAA
ncbi:phosphatase PAP2 family protein [Nocardia sp. NPDC050712]|uniref:phosphatase PAP2 family protein n=1 Tax=Nocardia sp. NPDC050712 TaxID=3155518 RepID=UPI0034115F16